MRLSNLAQLLRPIPDTSHNSSDIRFAHCRGMQISAPQSSILDRGCKEKRDLMYNLGLRIRPTIPRHWLYPYLSGCHRHTHFWNLVASEAPYHSCKPVHDLYERQSLSSLARFGHRAMANLSLIELFPTSQDCSEWMVRTLYDPAISKGGHHLNNYADPIPKEKLYLNEADQRII